MTAWYAPAFAVLLVLGAGVLWVDRWLSSRSHDVRVPEDGEAPADVAGPLADVLRLRDLVVAGDVALVTSAVAEAISRGVPAGAAEDELGVALWVANRREEAEEAWKRAALDAWAPAQHRLVALAKGEAIAFPDHAARALELAWLAADAHPHMAEILAERAPLFDASAEIAGPAADLLGRVRARS